MGNKNRELIIAYFSDVASAEQASSNLIDWDHQNHAVKLGSIGIISMTDDGKVKTKKIGNRTSSTATDLTAPAADRLQGASSADVHQSERPTLPKVDLSDTQKARLEQHLGNGGAALALMADLVSAEAATAKLNSWESESDHITVSAETLSLFAAAANAVQTPDESLSATRTDGIEIDPGAEEGEELNPKVAALVSAVRTLNIPDAIILHEHGISTVADLLEAGASAKGRRHLAAATGLESAPILKWVNDVDLARVRGIGVKYADLLERAGVDTVPDLARRNPSNLYAKLGEVNEIHNLVVDLPPQKHVEDWIAQAKELPRIITY